MNIPTARTQAKVAELLHELDGCQHGNGTAGLASCSRNDEYTVRSAFFLAKLMPSISMEMFPAVRDDMRERIHDKIVAELVCCEIFEELEAIGKTMSFADLREITPRDLADKHGLHFHHLCYYGAWAASIALNQCPSGQRKCDPSYFCPTSSQWESPCHGGFDVCCDHPDLHQTMERKTGEPARSDAHQAPNA